MSAIIGCLRDSARRPESSLDDITYLPSAGPGPENSLMQIERDEALQRLVRRLPPDRQQLLILKFVENYSNAEIGQVMGRTEGAVKSLYHRTLLALRDLAGENFF